MRILLALILLTIIGCTDSSDSQVSGGQFTVHFNNTKDHDLAKDIVKFWKSDSLITGKPQDVRLKRTNGGYDLLLIATEKMKADTLTFEDIRSLTELEQRLQANVFGDKTVTIVVADENFKPLYRPTL
ncbi:MAG: hypothetical protein NXI10_08825 [bacterium]|nr:hypothetical protein [bacterium]